MLQLPRCHGVLRHGLSILIRSEERMLPRVRSPGRTDGVLSILIRSEERMLLACAGPLSTERPFNPHPLRRADATCSARITRPRLGPFNPHPLRRADATHRSTSAATHALFFQSSSAPKSGCYVRAPGIQRASRPPFNPHPLRRADATSVTPCVVHARTDFQSSSAPKSGCYPSTVVGGMCFDGLSILIRSEERMLPKQCCHLREDVIFQSSSAPKSGCYRQ